MSKLDFKNDITKYKLKLHITRTSEYIQNRDGNPMYVFSLDRIMAFPSKELNGPNTKTYN